MTIVEPCTACGRHVRSTEVQCPFCAAPHEAQLAPSPPPRAPSRAAIAAWAGILVASCGGAQPAEETSGEGTGGDENTNTTEDTTTTETTTANEDANQQEESCAGRCGSHHQPSCPTCPAPPYGAPPIDDTIV